MRTLFGISVFWLALSLLFDGINTLLLPSLLLGAAPESRRATLLGLLTFFGLLAGMLVQPYAGAWSDRLRPRWGRRGPIGAAVLLLLAALALLGAARGLLLLALGYLAIQLAASVAQAAQQGFIPDLVAPRARGLASGLKGLMDLLGAMLGFVLLGQLLGAGAPGLALALIAGALVLGYGLTVALVREARPMAGPGQAPRPSLLDVFRLDLSQHRAFVWLVVARFLFLLGTYAIGRFLLLFVADRLGLEAAAAAEQAGNLLAALALVTVLAAVPAGWAADRLGRLPLMLAGAALGALGAGLLIWAESAWHILLFGAALSLGNAAFAGANWALTADLAPQGQAARFMGLANFGTAGAAAVAGLLGPLVDGGNALVPGAGYTALFLAAALAMLGSAVALRGVVLAPAAETPAAVMADD